jgi:hypothetical protein
VTLSSLHPLSSIRQHTILRDNHRRTSADASIVNLKLGNALIGTSTLCTGLPTFRQQYLSCIREFNCASWCSHKRHSFHLHDVPSPRIEKSVSFHDHSGRARPLLISQSLARANEKLLPASQHRLATSLSSFPKCKYKFSKRDTFPINIALHRCTKKH